MSVELGASIHAERLNRRIEELAQIGRIGETGVCRLALSKEDRAGVERVKSWMEEAGMRARIDPFGNLIGVFKGKNPELPVLMLGSHVDSQPYGGRYDGAIGVLGAIEVVQTMAEKGFIPEMDIEVVAFCDEEGCRFNKGLFGVRGMTGKLEEGELDRKDKNGVTRREALLEFGCDPAEFEGYTFEPARIGAFLELHIEQGPVLESLDSPIGIVSGISGPLWWTVELNGFAGHAGSVPMPMRRDALVGAAKVIVALNDLARLEEGASTVGTVGSLTVFPDSRNIIPEKVTFTVDLRDIVLSRRNEREQQLLETIQDICDEHDLQYLIREDTNSEPRYCAEWMKEILRKEGAGMGMQLPELMSGPFHDSLTMSYVCDYSMIFVRCKEGISHNPKEYSSPEDIALGAELLYRAASRIASGTDMGRRSDE
ncbi:allantoate deiminase/N-carbamoyl-L-amino-acid hydrolase [Paenibacillus catalpae]|uniref:Allantoate deiminase/N-carbamoyl-L-amino-acid hydrolase n=1 Tax=Paenibacillus catalpae TaxID=1045775 RepID=A0A1I1YIE9_9BACL|nr:M20 family metallo-hydrolase [Paenibacillus catalpae]SFE19384.1 allantoate deiminase/N-carbamoyl-L-amino-acid hydrolase [Paenibacillus catalpae]